MRGISGLVLAGLMTAIAPTAAAAAPEQCRLVAKRSAVAFPLTRGCPGVRPGALVETPIGFCTLNFAFKGRRGARYVGTAGHCVIPGLEGEQTWRLNRGPKAMNADGEVIGRFAYGGLDAIGDRDFSLIRLKKAFRPNPEICKIGGPTGINRDVTSRPQTLEVYGNGTVAGQFVPARPLLALGLPNNQHVFATGVATPGDSGGPVISSDGRAVGVLVSGGVLIGGLGSDGADTGTIGITRIGPQVSRASFLLKEKLRLMTAPAG